VKRIALFLFLLAGSLVLAGLDSLNFRQWRDQTVRIQFSGNGRESVELIKINGKKGDEYKLVIHVGKTVFRDTPIAGNLFLDTSDQIIRLLQNAQREEVTALHCRSLLRVNWNREGRVIGSDEICLDRVSQRTRASIGAWYEALREL
jgi:hypothetical protein